MSRGQNTSTTTRLRGQCPRCLGTFTLKKDGTLWPHYGAVYEQSETVQAKRCEGTSAAPRDKRPLWR